MARVFYDADNNKEVYDVSGNKNIEDIKSEFGLGVNTQQVDTNSEEATEVIDGTLQKFNAKTRGEANAIAKEASRLGKETAMKAKLGLSDEEWADLKVALG